MHFWAEREMGKQRAIPAESEYFLQHMPNEELRRNNATRAENSWSTGPI
jgi:hypothetical protein